MLAGVPLPNQRELSWQISCQEQTRSNDSTFQHIVVPLCLNDVGKNPNLKPRDQARPTNMLSIEPTSIEFAKDVAQKTHASEGVALM